MRQINRSFALRALVGSSFLLALPEFGPAQPSYGIASGLNYAGPASSLREHYTSGFALQVSVDRRFGDRLGARLDAFVNHFAIQGPPAAVGVAWPLSRHLRRLFSEDADSRPPRDLPLL